MVTRQEGLLTEEQLGRYSRQMLLGQVGFEGQRRLLEARVLVIGAGGLGSPSAIYLAAAGIGTIGIVDGDRVDLSNLHRQILHFDHDQGRPKVQSARRHLEDLNPDVRVVTHPYLLSKENALEIIKDYDLVVNGCDNFPTRYLVNDACVFLGKPLVDASILQFDGQMTSFLPGQGCYRCLYPSPPPPGLVPSCAEAGIIGAVAGHMGTLQALEAVKIILRAGDPITHRLVLFDGLAGTYRSVKWRRDPGCPVCGDHPTITELIDYQQFCGLPSSAPAAEAAERSPAGDGQGLNALEASELIERRGVQVIDVRKVDEYRRGHIPGALQVPLEELREKLGELDRGWETTIVVCHIGQRSADGADILREAGFGNVYNLRGGMVGWINRQLPVEKD